MANSAQARKRARQAERHRLRNAAERSRVRTAIKKVQAAIATGERIRETAATCDAGPERSAARWVASDALRELEPHEQPRLMGQVDPVLEGELFGIPKDDIEMFIHFIQYGGRIQILSSGSDLSEEFQPQQGHEGSGDTMPGAIYSCNKGFVVRMAHPVKISTDNILGLEKDKMFRHHFCQ